MFRTVASLSLVVAVAVGHAQSPTGNQPFALHNGDRVAFYGDSITDNAAYTKYVEVYVRTHFPKLRVSFVNAGVGGDRVTGGWMGPIDQRLTRDLMSRKPTVVTVMLGMNDGSYRAFDQGIFDVYRNGYAHIADRFHAEIPKARIWLIQPSPFDDFTRDPSFAGGYNAVLLKYAGFVGDLAQQHSYGLIDFNGPVSSMLANAKAIEPEISKKILPDRVHPSAAGHLVMAASVVKAWGAPAYVSKVQIDAKTGSSETVDASVDVKQTASSPGGFAIAWDELESRLPFPYDQKDPLVQLVLKSWPVEDTFGKEMLSVRDLTPGSYRLTIDSLEIGTFSDADLSNGIDLGLLDTPMSRQAQHVQELVWQREDLRYNAWRTYEFGLQALDAPEKMSVLRDVERLNERLDRDVVAASQPETHHYVLTKL